jgi:hypothetical protein
MNNHSGIGVNGLKHICGGAEGEEARRDRRLSFGMPGGTGTSVKSPEPYLMPSQNMATANSRGGSRAVRFDMACNQTGSAESKIIKRRTHLTFMGNGAGILERERVAEKLNKPAPQITRREYE